MTSSSSGTFDADASRQQVDAACSVPLTFARIEPEWQGQIAVCVGCGPSLTHADLQTCKSAKVIVINDAAALAPWADVLYAPDGEWWKRSAHWAVGCDRQLSLDPLANQYSQRTVELLNYRTGDGLSLDPTTVKTGGHSGHQAINLAVHYRPRRIVLLGYDMCAGPQGQNHFFGEHHDGSHLNYQLRLGSYYTLIKPLARLGIEIVNASRVSAIDAFPRVSLAEALAS